MTPDPLRARRARANAATGRAAEEAFAHELERALGVVTWRPAANASRRYNRDVFGFDIVAIGEGGVTFAQVKATTKRPTLEPIWRARFLALPKPQMGVRYLLAWLAPATRERPAGWRVWLIRRDASLEELVW